MLNKLNCKMWKIVRDEAPVAPTGTPPPTLPQPPPTDGKKFSQEDVNRFVADEKRKVQTKMDQLTTQLETFKLTAAEKEDLQQKLTEMQNELLTKDELTAREKKKLEATLTKQAQQYEQEAKTWRNRYEDSTITRALMDAAIENEALVPVQLVEILRNKAHLADVLGEDGKSTGEFVTKCKIDVKDDKGVTKTLDLPVSEAIRQLKEMPERFGNLFKSKAVSGIGDFVTGKTSGSADPVAMSFDQYREFRKKSKEKGK